MNRINQFGLEPGPYTDQDGNELVVLEVLTDLLPGNELVGPFAPQKLADPLVVTRHLIKGVDKDDRLGIPLSLFKQKFTKA